MDLKKPLPTQKRWERSEAVRQRGPLNTYCQHEHQHGFGKIHEDGILVIAVQSKGKAKGNSILNFFWEQNGDPVCDSL
jgi:hypothetical protein